jgi:hypothetical protein
MFIDDSFENLEKRKNEEREDLEPNPKRPRFQ